MCIHGNRRRKKSLFCNGNPRVDRDANDSPMGCKLFSTKTYQNRNGCRRKQRLCSSSHPTGFHLSLRSSHHPDVSFRMFESMFNEETRHVQLIDSFDICQTLLKNG